MKVDYNSLKELINIDSPSGFTEKACDYIADKLSSEGHKISRTNKGAVKCQLGEKPKLVIAAHVDTLGAIISGFNTDGTIKFSLLGGLSLNMAEGAYCKIHTINGKEFTGTFLINDPSVHAHRHSKKERTIDNMHVRLDELVKTKEDIEKLGISIGDIITVNPNYQHLDNGFIKSRFLDNKAGCLVLFEIAKAIKAEGIDVPVELFFSNYEEVGHGAAAGYSEDIEEMLVIDMGVLGNACAGDELHCSICAKDSTGPYDYNFRKKLTHLAQENSIPHKVDVYPFYGSDGSAALAAGNDFRVALIGPGVAASHGVERTHEKGIEATVNICLAYIKDKF